MKTYVLFHAGCMDGLVAAWVVRKSLQHSGLLLGDHAYVPVHYDQPAPEVEPGSRLFIMDFCFPLEVMRRYQAEAHSMMVLDHHQSHAEVMKELANSTPETRGRRVAIGFDTTKSGCRLAWNMFFNGQQSPGIVDYAEDRDLWLWKMPGSREVNACLRSYPLEFSTLDKWGQLTYQQLYMEMFSSGEAILRYQKQIVDTHVHHAVETRIAGHDVRAVNATTLVSEIGQELARGRPFGAVFFQSEDGKIVWSLRSDKDGLDVSKIAQRFGGGGHPHAAGFTCSPQDGLNHSGV